MTITAKFDGVCRKCGGKILPGTKINWDRGQGAEHVECPAGQPEKTGPKKTGQLWEECPRCGREPVYMPLHLCDHCWPKYPVTPKIDTSCHEPYRRGIGQGFGATEDGEEE